MTSHHHEEKLKEALQHAAAEFISTVSNRTSLITVTGIKLGHKAGQATILVSVLPDTAEAAALNFLKRQRGEMRQFIGRKIALRQAPFIDVAIDPGANNEKIIDDITRSIK